jgi:hypothetical protein
VQRRRGDRLCPGDGEPRRHTGALVHRARLAQAAGEAGQDLDKDIRDERHQMRLLADHSHLVSELDGVVGPDLGPEPVAQRGDDAAAVGVVLGVRARHDQDVEGQAQHVAADLDVALLHHVEHRDLDPLGQVGQLVDGHDPAVRARDEPEVDGLEVAQAAALRHLHRVDVSDEVGHRGVRGGELLGIPLVPVAPRHRQVVAQLGRASLRGLGDRVERVLAELGPGDDRGPLVEEPDQGPQDAGLALPALAQQHDVVPGEEGTLQLRDDGVVEAVQARPRVSALGQRGQQVLSDLLAQRAGLVS